MLSKFRSYRPSQGTVVAYIALFVALGGTSYAAIKLPANSVGTKQLKKNAVTLKKIKASTRAALKGQRGDSGPRGATGATGPRGLTGSSTTPLRSHAAHGGCAPTMAGTGAMVKVGSFCIDRYEASVWSSPKGGTQYGVSSDDYPCNDNGQNCSNIYARSVPGVKPSRHITWFQAQQALANSGKRLPSNAEWQEAVRGTPDAGPDNGITDCNTGDPDTPFGTGSLVATGSRSSCVSDFGAYDMVGNLNEWVADWVPASNSCPGWGAVGNFSSDDTMCLSGASTTQRAPGALVRGNDYGGHRSAGPFTVYGFNPPSSSNQYIGFRGAG